MNFIEDNPFYYIKVHHIFLWMLLMTTAIAIQLSILDLTTDLVDVKNLEPISEILVNILILSFTLVWIIRQCKLFNINLTQVFGKFPNNYNWKYLFLLAIANVAFSMGIFQVTYYPVSFFAPDRIRNILGTGINSFSFSIYP